VTIYNNRLHDQKGFSLMEMLVTLTIGLTLLSALVAFFMNTSKNMRVGQEQAQSTSQAQLVLARMTKEIKGSANEAPALFAVTPNWDLLPALPYSSFELQPYPVTAGAVIAPAAPAARKFSSQVVPSDIYHKWYPNSLNESNSLVFYMIPAPGPTNTAQVERITYRLDTTDAANTKLLREVQRPIVSGSFSFQASPVPVRTVLAERVQLLQFTYPEFDRAMQAQGAALDTQLTDIQTNQGNSALVEFLNNQYRQVIGIRLVLGSSPVAGSQGRKGIELTTEVRLRN
jgi:prepilin-type N-terminal cleavage/methylation domain-containing protein